MSMGEAVRVRTHTLTIDLALMCLELCWAQQRPWSLASRSL